MDEFRKMIQDPRKNLDVCQNQIDSLFGFIDPTLPENLINQFINFLLPADRSTEKTIKLPYLTAESKYVR